MPPISRFDPPAKIRDFPRDPQKQDQLDRLWDQNAVGWTRQAMLGNPWNALHSSHQDFYYNPKETDIPASAAPIRVEWNASRTGSTSISPICPTPTAGRWRTPASRPPARVHEHRAAG